MTDLLIQSAIFVKGPGKAQVVNGLSIPSPNIGQLLVRTHAVTINPSDWMALDTSARPGAGMGSDFFGEVVQIGEGVRARWSVGDHVAGFVHGYKSHYVFASPSRHVKRGAETNATLYAYELNASSWPIAYGLDDGLLYITKDPDDSTANVTPLTWDLASITGECWIANATFGDGTAAGSMFIEQNNTMGVLPITRIAYVNGTVTGFALFASQLVYNNKTELEAQFWAKSTDTTGVYGLIWTPDGETPTGDFPVVVKASEDS